MSGALFHRILVAIDGSGPSRNAVRLALQVAQATGSRLIFCHVVDTEKLYGEAAMGEVDAARMLEVARRDGNDVLDAAGDEARAANLQADVALVEGPTVDAILDAAKAREAQLIILGTHGRTGLQRWALGSVAERVVRRAVCPVLTVRECVRC